MDKIIYPVLIVGAGPSGLTLALQLQRYKIPFRLIEKHPAPLKLSKAAAIHARTLEIFADLGLVETVLAAGQKVDVLDLRTRQRDRLRLDFSQLVNTDYPFMLDLPQYRTEQLLVDKLQSLGGVVERGVRLTELRQHENYVETRLVYEDGRQESCLAAWVVGSDGAKSTVRTLAWLDFVGSAYADDWVLSDARLQWPLPRNEMTFSSSPAGIFGVFPLPGENNYRLAYTQTRDEAGKLVEPSLADVQESLARTGISGQVLEADQFWTFNLAHRHVKQSRQGRVLLIGDAAHIHTPFGGQGMNLGIADAYNLGWKLAYVLHGYATSKLLDSYQSERASVVKAVIRTTHYGVTAMLVKQGWRGWLRDKIMGLAGSSRLFSKKLTISFSQLSHHYQASPVVAGRSGPVRAGDRLANQRFFDGITQSYTSLFELVNGPRHTLLVFTGDEPAQQAEVLQLIRERRDSYNDLLDIKVISPAYSRPADLPEDVQFWSDRGRNLTLFHRRHTTAYLVRPDKYIGFIQTHPSWAALDSYLKAVLEQGRVTATGPKSSTKGGAF